MHRFNQPLHLSTYKAWLCALWLTALAFQAPSVQAQSASTTLASGSYLGVTAQVVSSANGNLNSTDAISSNDTVQWTNFFQSKLPSPFKSIGVIKLPPGFKWVQGSVQAPSNAVLRYCLSSACTAADWLAAEPATGTVVTQVEWTLNPLVTITAQPAVAGTVNFTGTGDGYRVIAYKDKLFVVNHHTAQTYLNCRMAETGAPCPGFTGTFTGRGIPTTLGADVVYGGGGAMNTPNRSIEHLNVATGELFLYMADSVSGVKMVCANLNTMKACMNAATMVPDGVVGAGAANPIGSVDSKYYAVAASGKLMCFDTATKTPCAGQPYEFAVPLSGSSVVMGTVMAGKLFVADGANQIKCINSNNHQHCPGWNNVFVGASPLIGPVLNIDGSPKGVCTWYGCRTLTGDPFTRSSSYASWFDANPGWAGGAYIDFNTFGTRVFHAPNGYAQSYASCFDFATDAPCPGFPLPSNGAPLTYSVFKDYVRNNCMWALGDQAMAKSFNPLTGGDCPAAAVVPPTVTMNVKPSSNYQCDGSKGLVRKWGKVRFSPALTWGSNGITAVNVKIMDAAGALLPASQNPTRSFTYGTFELDISDIAYSTYPHLKFELTLSSGSQPITAEVGFDVTWDGDPIQLCFKNTAPVLDNCQVGVDVTQSNAAVHVPTAIELLNASSGLTPGRTQAGVGPGVTSTTLRQYPVGSSDPTQVLQTRYNLNNLTGDLWQYPLLADFSLALSPSYKASTNTANRTLWTAKPQGSSGNLTKVALDHSNLSNAQQAALKFNAQGIIDNLGAQRVAYLAGSSANEVSNGGTFRNRASVLGTAIDSSATVLPKGALAGYNDAQFPNYSAYRTALARSDALAFYSSNDGMLHAYKVRSTGLTQAFSYLPSMLLAQAATQTDKTIAQARNAPYWLDNTPMVREVNLGNNANASQWSSVVVANQGRGGRGVFALEVKSGNLDNVLFEYDNNSHPDLIDMGYVMGQPSSDAVAGAAQIVRLGDERWAYVTGNGIDSNKGATLASNGTGRAVLYMFYLNGSGGGPKWRKIPVNTTPNPDLDVGNGLGTPRLVDANGDGKVDLIYAGDRKGNLWRFDVSDINNPVVTKLFKTTNGQPIYTAPMVVKSSGGGTCPANETQKCWMVTVGTGEALNPLTTTNSTVTQAVYGLFDKGETGAAGLVTDSQLIAQTLTTGATVAGITYRTVSNNPVTFTSGTGGVRGWKLNLTAAEHTSSNPQLQANGSIMLATTRPSGASIASCAAGDSWLTVVNPQNGGGANTSFGSGNPASSGASTNLKGVVYGELGVLSGKLNSNTESFYLPNLGGSVPTGAAGSGNSCTPGTFGKDGSYCATSSSMIGRMSWREVFGLPK